jgi:cob(I)alamin adenosyltransferase
MTFTTGYTQIYTGDGKGKTTAALGLALRAAGAGLNVYIAQFIKSGDYSEIKALARFADRITVEQFGLGRFIKGKPSPEDVAAAGKGLAAVRNALKSGQYQVVIMEEGNVAAMCGLFPVDEILEIMTQKPGDVELVVTGRGADPRGHRPGRSGDGNESGQTLLSGRGGGQGWN